MSEQVHKFDDVFHIIGEGAFQLVIFAIISIAAFFSMESIWINFTAYTPKHWCHVSKLENLPFDIQKKVAIPQESNCYEQCRMYALVPWCTK